MQRVVFVVPGLLGEPDLISRNDFIRELAGESEMFRIAPLPPLETPEALVLGMKADEGQLRQGPLTIAALGVDPPARSTHFHLSLLSFDDGKASEVSTSIDHGELRVLLDAAKRLNTKSLTLIEGAGFDHGLVWEDVGELCTHSPSGWKAVEIEAQLPQGDAERILRRYIDDSINLLSELDFNRRRLDEEKQALNLLWPWGNGLRYPVPNLALGRGEPATVCTQSMRLSGLARLCGYKAKQISKRGSGIGFDFARVTDDLSTTSLNIVYLPQIGELRARSMLEEAEWLARHLSSEVFMPLVTSSKTNGQAIQISILAPSDEGGLGFFYNSERSLTGHFPFGSETIYEKALPQYDLDQSVRMAIEVRL